MGKNDGVFAGRIENRIATILLSLILVVAFFLRFNGLSDESYWLDELFSVTIADPDRPVDAMVDSIRTDVHPPLYYLLLRVWTELFGTGEIAARSLSAVFGFAAVLFAAAYYRRLSDVWTHLTFLGLLATSFGATWYAQEARSYSLLLFLSTVLTGAGLAIIHDARHERRIRPGTLILLIVGSITAGYVHYFGNVIAIACFLTVMVFLWGRAGMIRTVLLAAMVSGTAVLGWMIYHVPHIDHLTGGNFWIVNNVATVISSVLQMLFGHWASVYGIGAALIIYVFVRAGGARPIVSDIRPAIAVVGLCLVIPAAISLHSPVLTARNLIIIFPATYFAVAHVLNWIAGAAGANGGWRVIRVASVAVLVAAMMLPSLESKTMPVKAQWREAAAAILAEPACRRATILVSGSPEPAHFAFYAEREDPDFDVTFVLAPSRGPVPAAVAAAQIADDCPVVWWETHTIGSRRSVQSLFPDRDPADFRVERFIGSNVYFDKR